jgi:23S rRNA pseudouridine2605 synthase
MKRNNRGSQEDRRQGRSDDPKGQNRGNRSSGSRGGAGSSRGEYGKPERDSSGKFRPARPKFGQSSSNEERGASDNRYRPNPRPKFGQSKDERSSDNYKSSPRSKFGQSSSREERDGSDRYKSSPKSGYGSRNERDASGKFKPAPRPKYGQSKGKYPSEGKKSEFTKENPFRSDNPLKQGRSSEQEYNSPKQDYSSPKGKFDKRDDSAEYKTVYTGRGKNERPQFATVRKDELERGKKRAPKNERFFKKGKHEPTEPKPEYNFDKFEKNHRKHQDNDEIRLNKYIANSGICSRREADSIIEKGQIRVNGEVITEMGYKVERKDKVTYNGKVINPEKPVYVLLNKPKDFITTTDDPMDRRTVMNLVSSACEERIFPVGRLDRNTTGLLLFTNDGELAAKLSHPSSEIKKIYQVTLDKPLSNKDADDIVEGLTLEDGPVKVDDLQVLSKDRTILGLEIHVGKNRIVRRIFAHLGYEVTALDRVMYAGLTKKDLTRGKYRFLSEKEVINLKYFK